MGIIQELTPRGGAYPDAFAGLLAEKNLSRHQVPQGSSDPREVRNLASNELLLDGNVGQNLATFCTTYDDENVRYLMDHAINKNVIDKDEYPTEREDSEPVGAHARGPLARSACGRDDRVLDGKGRAMRACWQD